MRLLAHNLLSSHYYLVPHPPSSHPDDCGQTTVLPELEEQVEDILLARGDANGDLLHPHSTKIIEQPEHVCYSFTITLY